MGQHHHPTAAAGDGAGSATSQFVNSPRFSGPMTRRANSFNRNNNRNNNSSSSSHHQNETTNELLQTSSNSPRSENPDGIESFRASHVAQRAYLRRKVSSLSVDMGGIGVELKKKKRFGHWVFVVFCGVCLFWGGFKICASGWFGSVDDGVGKNNQVVDGCFFS